MYVFHIFIEIFLVFVPASKQRRGGKPKATWATCDVSRAIRVVGFVLFFFLMYIYLNEFAFLWDFQWEWGGGGDLYMVS